MALIFAEGFDDFTSATDLALSAAAAGVNTGTVTGRGGQGKAAATSQYTSGYHPSGWPDATPNTIVWAFTGLAELYAGFSFSAVGPLAHNNTTGYVVFFSGVHPLFAISQEAAAAVAFYDQSFVPANGVGSSIIGSSAFSNLNSYIEVHLIPGPSGTVTVKIDGTTVFTYTGNLGATGLLCDSIGLSCFNYATSAQPVAYLDDLYVCDTTGTTNKSFLGDTRILSAAPTSDGTHTAFVPHSGTNQTAMVSESPIDYDTTYTSAANVGDADTFHFPALPTLSGYGILRAVQIVSYCRTDSGGVAAVAGAARVAGADYTTAASQSVPASYKAVRTVFESNPATGNAWTDTQVNGAEFGISRTA